MTFVSRVVGCSLLLLSVQAGVVHAEAYGTLQLGFMAYEEPGKQEGFTAAPESDTGFSFLQIGAGYRMHPYCDMELRLNAGLSDGSVTAAGGSPSYDVSLGSSYGAYLKLKADKLVEYTTPYLVTGFERSKMELLVTGGALQRSQSSIPYGVGVEFSFWGKTAVTFEWMQHIHSDAFELSGLSMGVSATF